VKDLFYEWKDALLIVKPETLIKWHRQGFKLYWKWKSQQKTDTQTARKKKIDLVKKMASQNPSWGAPRIHGEMLMLGFDISESTVRRILCRRRGGTSGQRWKTFLQNHASEIVALDFFSVPTMNLRILYVLVFLSIERRIIFFNVTEHPNSEWSIQQLRNAFYDEPTLRFLIRDRDKKFGKAFTESTRSFGIHPILTAYCCPWQNGFA
jgi:hypothetical protein